MKTHRLIDAYIHNRNLFSKGDHEVSWVWGFLNLGMVASLYVDRWFPDLPGWATKTALAGLFVLRLFGPWLFGYIWDKKGWYDREHTWGNRRNPIMRVLSEKTLEGRGLE